jgi:hypothetical protein
MHTDTLIHPKWETSCSPTLKIYINRLFLIHLSNRTLLSLALASLALLTAVMSAKAAAGKSVLKAESGAGLLKVTEVEPGTLVLAGDSATRYSSVGKAARRVPLSADAIA